MTVVANIMPSSTIVIAAKVTATAGAAADIVASSTATSQESNKQPSTAAARKRKKGLSKLDRSNAATNSSTQQAARHQGDALTVHNETRCTETIEFAKGRFPIDRYETTCNTWAGASEIVASISNLAAPLEDVWNDDSSISKILDLIRDADEPRETRKRSMPAYDQTNPKRPSPNLRDDQKPMYVPSVPHDLFRVDNEAAFGTRQELPPPSILFTQLHPHGAAAGSSCSTISTEGSDAKNNSSVTNTDIESLVDDMPANDQTNRKRPSPNLRDDQKPMYVPSVPHDVFCVDNEAAFGTRRELPHPLLSMSVDPPPSISCTQLHPHGAAGSSCSTISTEGSNGKNNSSAINTDIESLVVEMVYKRAESDQAGPLLSRIAVSHQNQNQANTQAPTLSSVDIALVLKALNEVQPHIGKDRSTGRWTDEEHNVFLSAVLEHGKDWKTISKCVKTRTPVQARTHAQKYVKKMANEKQKKEGARDGVGGKGSIRLKSQNEIQTNVANHHKTGQWSKEEHNRFLAALLTHGKDWKKITAYVKTRTILQVRTHAQKYVLRCKRLKLQEQHV